MLRKRGLLGVLWDFGMGDKMGIVRGEAWSLCGNAETLVF